MCICVCVCVSLRLNLPSSRHTDCASYAEMRGLLLESTLMHSFSHSHILSLRGLSLNPQSGAPYLVMPFMEHGDLRKFLRKKADMSDGGSSVTTYPQVCVCVCVFVSMCLCVCVCVCCVHMCNMYACLCINVYVSMCMCAHV